MCPKGFVYNAARLYCHRLINIRLNYTDAISHCKALKASLVRVNDAAENYLGKMLQDEGKPPLPTFRTMRSAHAHMTYHARDLRSQI